MKTLVKIHAKNINSIYGYIIDTVTSKSGTAAIIKVGNRVDWMPWLCEQHCIILGEKNYEIISAR